ncbi:hypothetical protein H632_c3043p0, partial [Helicosporidium sp. ATCC 50920]
MAPKGRGAAPLRMEALPVLHKEASVEAESLPLPARWQAALQNVQEARANVASLSGLVEEGVFLGEDEWKQAVPMSRMTYTLRAQQQRVVALERLLSETQHALSTSEARRQSAEAEIGDLRSQVQDAARSSALHADALVEKEEEIRNLHVVIESMARGGGAGGG